MLPFAQQLIARHTNPGARVMPRLRGVFEPPAAQVPPSADMEEDPPADNTIVSPSSNYTPSVKPVISTSPAVPPATPVVPSGTPTPVIPPITFRPPVIPPSVTTAAAVSPEPETFSGNIREVLPTIAEVPAAVPSRITVTDARAAGFNKEEMPGSRRSAVEPQKEEIIPDVIPQGNTPRVPSEKNNRISREKITVVPTHITPALPSEKETDLSDNNGNGYTVNGNAPYYPIPSRSFAPSAKSTPDPVIRVSIGRIEIKAVSAKEPEKKSSPPPKAAMSLEDFLKQRNSR